MLHKVKVDTTPTQQQHNFNIYCRVKFAERDPLSLAYENFLRSYLEDSEQIKTFLILPKKSWLVF